MVDIIIMMVLMGIIMMCLPVVMFILMMYWESFLSWRSRRKYGFRKEDWKRGEKEY